MEAGALISQIDVLGIPVKVRMVSSESKDLLPDCHGTFWGDRSLIVINKALSPAQQEETLLHEVGRAVSLYLFGDPEPFGYGRSMQYGSWAAAFYATLHDAGLWRKP
jgi:hypothetical protein